jgi:hypothetical protein
VDDRLLSYQGRSALPDEMVRYLEEQSDGTLTAISWIEPNRLRFIAHYELEESKVEDRMFRHRALGRPKVTAGILRR